MSVDQNRPSQLEKKDQPYWGIFEAVSDGLIIHDSETQRIVEANSAAAAMHGYSVEEFIGLPLAAYIHPDSRNDFFKSTQTVQYGEVLNSRAVYLRRDGSPFYVEVH